MSQPSPAEERHLVETLPDGDSAPPDGLSHATWSMHWALYSLTVLIAGAAGGILWHGITPVPYYTVGEAGTPALMPESGLALVFGMDVSYSIIGIVLGAAVGVSTRLLLYRAPAIVVFVGAAGAFVAGLITWQIGDGLGPNDFAARMATALPGDQVPVDFLLHAKSALACWPLGACVAILVMSLFGRRSPDRA
jgi:hypothetical protein